MTKNNWFYTFLCLLALVLAIFPLFLFYESKSNDLAMSLKLFKHFLAFGLAVVLGTASRLIIQKIQLNTKNLKRTNTAAISVAAASVLFVGFNIWSQKDHFKTNFEPNQSQITSLIQTISGINEKKVATNSLADTVNKKTTPIQTQTVKSSSQSTNSTTNSVTANAKPTVSKSSVSTLVGTKTASNQNCSPSLTLIQDGNPVKNVLLAATPKGFIYQILCNCGWKVSKFRIEFRDSDFKLITIRSLVGNTADFEKIRNINYNQVYEGMRFRIVIVATGFVDEMGSPITVPSNFVFPKLEYVSFAKNFVEQDAEDLQPKKKDKIEQEYFKRAE